MTGWLLSVAALLFWLSWALMPGVGVTDPAQIFTLVSSQRPLVAASVVLQLVSAGLYAPALIGVVTGAGREVSRPLRWAAILLLIGAMGSAADAVLHLLAYAMTAPDLDRAPLVRVMAFMQGPGLLLLAPMVLSFFAGGAVLAQALAKARIVSPWNLRLHGIALAIAIGGGLMASSGLVPARMVGLTVLACVAGAQVWSGAAASQLTRPREQAPAAIR
jgi:hypothetical protein